MSKRVLIIVMGASGCGKSSIGLAVAQALNLPFVDADDLHPANNVEKMANSIPLNDEDRLPWLHKIRKTALILTSRIGAQRLNSASTTSIATSSNENYQIDSTESIDEEELEYSISKVHPGSLHPPNSLDQTVITSTTSSDSKPAVVVIACSALKLFYRDILRGKNDESETELTTYFIYLHGTKPLLLNRMKNRPGHFMKSDMLDSQLATLEPPIETTDNQIGEIRTGSVKLGKGIEDSEERGLELVIHDSVDLVKGWLCD